MTVSPKAHSTRSAGYAKGHDGDPQYWTDDPFTVEIPKNMFALELVDENGKTVADGLNIDNPEESIDGDDLHKWGKKNVPTFFKIPTFTMAQLQKLSEGEKDVALVLVDTDGEHLEKIELSKLGGDAQINEWVKKTVEKFFEAFLKNPKNEKIKDYPEPPEPPDDSDRDLYRHSRRYASSEVVPTLEALMEKFEKSGMDKYASRIRDVVSMLGLEPFKLKDRLRHSRGSPVPGSVRTIDYSEKMLQEGDRYEDIDPTTGKITHKRYQMDKPLPVSKLGPYFHKGMHSVDFFQDQYDNETDPVRKKMFKDLLDRAVKEEEHLRGVRMAAQVIAKCASTLRDKGYVALADRLATGIYLPGKGVRIRSFKEYMDESRAKGGDKDTSLYDEMFDKYISVFESASKIVKDAKQEMHSPKGLEDALEAVVVADQLMMKKLLEIGEIAAGAHL